MLIFGTRAGGKVTTLLKNFEGELSNARTELGSLPAILDKTNQSLDELGDKLTNSIGNKLNEFAVGALAGAQGANDLANALSKIDAAGAGLSVGNLARFVATNPLKALEALGNTLLSVGATIANEIAAQVMAAFKGLVNVIVSGDFWSGVGNVVQGALLQAARAFEFAIVDAIAKALEAASRIPVAGKMFEGLGEAARQEANKAADAYRAASEQMRQGMSQAGGAFMDAGRGVYNRQDLFGEAHYAGRAVANYESAMGSNNMAAPSNGTEAQMQSLRDQFGALQNKMPASPERKAQEDEIINAMKALRDGLQQTGSGSLLPAMTEMQNRSANPLQNQTPPERDEQEQRSKQPSDQATETTLQRVANFLEELTGKLPQPVLV